MKWRFPVFGLLVGLLFTGPALAGYGTNIFFDGTLNKLKFENYEVILRVGANQGVNNVTIDSTPGVGGGDITYSVIDPFAAATIDGDIVIQILEATDLINLDQSPAFSGEPMDVGLLTAYFVGKVSKVAPPSSSPIGDIFVPLAAADTDPFGVLVGDGMRLMRWYIDSTDTAPLGTRYVDTDADQGDALERIVASVADGTNFLEFGVGLAADSSGFSGGAVEVIGLSGTPPSQFEVTGALNVLDLFGKGLLFHDSGEITTGPAGTDSSIEFTQTVSQASNYDDASGAILTSKTPWFLFSDDPLYLTATPEPGAVVALVGMFVVCVGGALIRRFRH